MSGQCFIAYWWGSGPQSLEVSKIKKNKKTSKNLWPKFFEVFLFFFIFETSSDCGVDSADTVTHETM
jgi:hypothetical protein